MAFPTCEGKPRDANPIFAALDRPVLLTRHRVLSTIHSCPPQPTSTLIRSLSLIRPVESIMAKVLYCNELVPGCQFEARGMCDEEVVAEFADHVATAHNMLEISDEILVMINNAIHEEARVRARSARA